ncbi:MAG TPA: hypothetical protein PLW99_01090 [Candidatus Paceibacterota bacterium]|nr:hypothetical protein [Candidatus Paceibacterota bacterium]
MLTNVFHSDKKEESVVLVDIGASSVAGAYAHYAEGAPPVLLYAARVPVAVRPSEAPEDAMLRALQSLGEVLIREGAPALARAAGSGHISAVLVSIDSPWQTTAVHIEHFEEGEPFIFTKSAVTEKLKGVNTAIPGKTLTDEGIIGTTLNGYETTNPYGRVAHRASAVILSSFIDTNIAASVRSALQAVYHTRRVLPVAGSSLRYQAMRQAFPHEREALILDATGPLTSIALLRHGLFVAVVEVADTGGAWVDGVTKELAGLAKNYPLPRTLFLLAREQEAAAFQKAFATVKFGDLWLSDAPPKIIAVLASHLSALVRQAAESSPDLPLLLMALYWRYRAPD